MHIVKNKNKKRLIYISRFQKLLNKVSFIAQVIPEFGSMICKGHLPCDQSAISKCSRHYCLILFSCKGFTQYA